MSENDPKPCPQCGKPLPADAPGGLCPSCVMAMNLSPETRMSTADPADPAATKAPPLSPEEMTERFPNFEILECLGRGGMGVVYKARQKALDREVAIKVLAGEWQDDPEFAKRFEREAKTLAQMSHPNIVTVHDFGEADGLYYIVMEYVDGVNLRDLLTDGKLEPEHALAIVPPICDALEYAHGKGVVHRDIKPENLLLDREGRVKIADFGIASLVGSTTEISGTPSYMAPEQISGRVDRRADIYALGVVLYEMLTGKLPDTPLQPPSQKVQIDVRLDEIVLRALEHEPDLRYQQASVLKTDVETIVAQAADSESRRRMSEHADVMTNKSQMVRLLEVVSGTPFTSPLAMKLANMSALGFLGSLAFLGYVPIPGMQRCFAFSGFAGFFGLIGVAFIAEQLHRKHGSRGPERDSSSADMPGGSAPGFHSTPSYGSTGLATAITFFYAGMVLSILLVDFLPFGFNRDSAYLLGVGLMLAGAPFVGVAASNALRRAYAGRDRVRRDGVAAWLRAVSVVAGLLAIPVIGFAIFFLRALFTEQGGWHPALSESVLVPLTWLGAVLLPACFACLWWEGAKAAETTKPGNAQASAESPWPRRVFWLLASLLITTPLVFLAGLLAAQAARLGADDVEVALWLMGAAVVTILALAPPVMAVLSLRRDPADTANPWPRRIVLLLCAIPAALLGLFAFVLVPVWMASRYEGDIADSTTKAALREAEAATDDFGTEREAVLLELEAKGEGTRFLDVDSGKTHSMSERQHQSDAETVDWMTDEGLDLFAERIGERWGLVTARTNELKLARIPENRLTDVSPNDLRDILEQADLGLEVKDEGGNKGWRGYFLPEPVPAGLALVFRTAEGAVGVLRIDEVKNGPARLKICYKLVRQKNEGSHDGTEQAPVEPTREAFLGRWLWEEERSGDKVWLTIPEAGQGGMQGTDLGGQLQFHTQFEWTVREGKIEVTSGVEKAIGELTQDGSSLLMEVTKDGRRVLFQKTDQAPPVIATDLVVIEDLALHMIVAIREKDDQKLKSLATDRIKDWPDALPVFAVELRERYQQLVGDEEIDLRATESMVKDDLGLVRCTGPDVLNGRCLVLSFVKTPGGWKNCLLRNSTADVELRDHLSELERQLDAAQSNKGEE